MNPVQVAKQAQYFQKEFSKIFESIDLPEISAVKSVMYADFILIMTYFYMIKGIMNLNEFSTFFIYMEGVVFKNYAKEKRKLYWDIVNGEINAKKSFLVQCLLK
jgi:hypothetical protein